LFIKVDHRFPSPRYASSDPYPAILSESSPFPSPVPYPLKSPFDQISPFPISAQELHIRLILQSIATQIDEIWNSGHATVLARDFMIVQVPGHEITDGERSIVDAHLKESAEVAKAWQESGGVYVESGRGKEWIGLDPEPKNQGASSS
jgi:ribonuclease Z